MSSTFHRLNPDYHHGEDEEPTDDWTFQEAMQWCLLQCMRAVDNEVDGITNDLLAQKEACMEKLRALQRLVEQAEQADDDEEVSAMNNDLQAMDIDIPDQKKNARAALCSRDENQKPPPAAAADATSDSAVSKPIPKGMTLIECVDGPLYRGKVFPLKLTGRTVAHVGRSTAEKFRENGMSLSKDHEVSTTHGKFQKKQKKYYYTDVGSTNGTKILGGPDLTVGVPLELSTGLKLVIGAHTYQITLPS